MAELTKEAKRSIVRSMIPKYIDQKMTSAAGLRALKEVGAGMRKTDFLKIWSEISGMKQVEERAKFTPRKFRPTVATITPSTKKFTQEYNNIFKIREGTNHPLLKDGQYISINSDQIHIIEELAEKLSGSLTEFNVYGEMNIVAPEQLVYVGTLRRVPGEAFLE